MSYRWTLTYNGELKIYVLTQYQLVGEKWYEMGTTEWSYIEAPLEHIAKMNTELVWKVRN